jgi:uncharacterized protein YoxC
MGDVAGIIAVVLVAILVGAILPVLYHAVQTLKSVRAFVDSTGPRINEAMKEITGVAARLNVIASTLEEEGRRLKPVVDSAANIGRTISSLGESVRSAGSILGALTPAFVAGMRAFFTRNDDDDDDAPDDAGNGASEGSDDSRRAPVAPGPEGSVRRGL